MNEPQIEIANVEQIAQIITNNTSWGMKELLQEGYKFNPRESAEMRDADRYGNREHGILTLQDAVLYATRSKEGRQIVDDTVQPPKTRANPYGIKLVADRDDLKLTNVEHENEVDDEWHNEEAIEENVTPMEVLSGEFAEIEDFSTNGNSLVVYAYEPYEIGSTEITISGFSEVDE